MNKVLLFFSLKYKGNWDKIYDALDKKEKIDHESLENVESKISCSYITILDSEYPNNLRLSYKPPFVLFYKGNIKLIKSYYKTIGFICEAIKSEKSIDKINNICKKINLQKHIILTTYDYCSSEIIVEECLAKKYDLICMLKSSIKEKMQNHKSLNNIINNNGLIISEYYEDYENNNDEKICFSMRLFAGLSKSLIYFAVKFNEVLKKLINYSNDFENNIFLLCEDDKTKKNFKNNLYMNDLNDIF